MNPRPEIVLPPGFSLRIDYDPASSPSSLIVTAFHGDAPVGQVHLDPREVGLRLRLDVETPLTPASDGSLPSEPRLRLTPRNSRAIEMGAVRAELADVAEQRGETGAVEPYRSQDEDCSPGPHSANSVVWLENGTAVVLPSWDEVEPARARTGLLDAIRAAAAAALGLLSSPLPLPALEPEGWASWRATWQGLQSPSVASDG